MLAEGCPRGAFCCPRRLPEALRASKTDQKRSFPPVCRPHAAGYAASMTELPTPLPPRTRAPKCTLPRSRHASVSLNNLHTQYAVLALYPADREPVCREQRALYTRNAPRRDVAAEKQGGMHEQFQPG